MRKAPIALQTTTAASALPPGRIAGNGGDILDPSNLHAVPRQRPEGGLGARSRAAALVAPRPSDLHVERRHAELLAPDGDVLGGEHGRVRRRLVAVGLDLHAPGDAHERLASREVGDVDEGVVEGGEEVRDGEDLLALDEVCCCSFAVFDGGDQEEENGMSK